MKKNMKNLKNISTNSVKIPITWISNEKNQRKLLDNMCVNLVEKNVKFAKIKTAQRAWTPGRYFLLLALKIPLHFISLKILENYLQFYMTIAFKLNRTKIKVHHKFEIAFNFKKEIPLKCLLSPLGIP